jgi:uncharacterized protein (PEP-CTERM system associated)
MRIGIAMSHLAFRLLLVALPLACGTAALAQGLPPPPMTGGYTPATGGVLPPAGVDTRVGDLRGYFAQAFGNIPAPQAPAIAYSAGLDVSEIYDTNAVTSDKGTHDFITQITPSLGVIADTARLTGSLFYNPSAIFFVYHGNQNHVAQNLNAASTAVVIPDWLFLDLRGYASEQAISGLNGPTSTTTLSRSNSVLTYSFSAAPTLRHQFGGLAVAELGYTISYTTYNTGTTTTPTQQALNQNTVTQGEHGLLSTGEDFGRLNNTLFANASQSTGSGLLATSHDNTITDTISYAISYSLSVNASVGYENLQYSGGNGYNTKGTTWSFGGHWAPSPDTSIDAGYGHNQGQTTFYLNASFTPAPNTHVFATRSQSVGTNTTNLQRSVANTSVGPNGVTFINNTNTPTLLTNNFIGVQPGLFRTTTTSVTAVVTHPRDLYTVGLTHSDSSQLSNGIEGSTVNNSSTSTYGTASWGHELSADLHSDILVDYGVNSGSGVTNQGFSNNQNSYLLNGVLTYSVSETLSVSASLTQTNAPSGVNGKTGSREIAIVSLHKTFF